MKKYAIAVTLTRLDVNKIHLASVAAVVEAEDLSKAMNKAIDVKKVTDLLSRGYSVADVALTEIYL